MKRIWSLFGCIRYREVLLLQGAPIMGMILSPGNSTSPPTAMVAFFVLANLLLVAHIWSLNDWADVRVDLLDGNKASHVFASKGITPRVMLCFSFVMLFASLSLFAWLSSRTFLIACGIAILGFVYSFPRIYGKAIVLLSSALHLLGGFLHFLLGYSLFAPVDQHALPTAFFFALIFTAGHSVQEVQDQEADRLTGVRTNAVVFGKAPVFCAALLVFLFAYGNLFYLASAGVVPIVLGPAALALCWLHLRWGRKTLRAGLSFESVQQFRRRYRVLFALIGLTVISTLFQY